MGGGGHRSCQFHISSQPPAVPTHTSCRARAGERENDREKESEWQRGSHCRLHGNTPRSGNETLAVFAWQVRESPRRWGDRRLYLLVTGPRHLPWLLCVPQPPTLQPNREREGGKGWWVGLWQRRRQGGSDSNWVGESPCQQPLWHLTARQGNRDGGKKGSSWN